MKPSTLLVALGAFQTVAAHTLFTTLFVNDVDQGDGTCVRMPMTPGNATNPINDLASNDMACGYDGTVSVARICPVDQSSKLGFLFREWPDNSLPGSLDSSHKGPCAVYMKPVASPTNDTAVGSGWFKIWDDGYDFQTSQWCTEKLMAKNGLLSVDIPEDLAGGYYLVRPELLALHQADKTPPNPQFYVGCAQIFLNSAATSQPGNTVSIPGYVNISDPSVLFNIYTPKWPYPMFGPEPYTIGSSPNTVVKPVESQGEGLLPGNVVLTNANWWGIELDSYSTVNGCWNASTACWDQCTACYNAAPPTGSANCKIWEAKCTDIQNACNANDFNGPPNRGKILNPQPTTAYTWIAAESSSSSIMPSGDGQFSSSTSSSASSSSLTSLRISVDSTCGGTTGQTCAGSAAGVCCSSHGWCGMGYSYCGQGCQPAFGRCSPSL